MTFTPVSRNAACAFFNQWIPRFLIGICLAGPFVLPAPSALSPMVGSWLQFAAGIFGLMLWLCLRGRDGAAKAYSLIAVSWLVAACMSALMAVLQVMHAADWAAGWVSESAHGQAVANLLQRNHVASLMTIGLCAAFFLVQQQRATGVERSDAQSCAAFDAFGLYKALGMIAVALMAGANALTTSRTGALELACVYVIYRVFWSPKKLFARRLIDACLCVYLGVSAGLFALSLGDVGLMARIDDPNALSRLSLWSNVLELIAQKPWLGHGWRSLAYAHYSTEFSGARFMEMLDNAHNLPLHLAVELGLPVALIFCGGVVWLIWKNKPWTETQPDRQLAWGILMVIGIHSMVEYPLWYGPFFMTAVICVGILCADIWRNWLIALTKPAQTAINLGIKAFALLLLTCTVFAAFDYHRVSQIYLQPEERSRWYTDDPLGAAKKSVLFQSHAKFAELQITPLSRESAPRVLALSSELVVWSPEPRIIEKLIESATMLGLDELAVFHLQRYKVAYPAAYALWSQRVL